MKMKFALATLLVVVALIGLSTASVQAATIGGVVLDARNNPVVGAVVTLQQVDVPRGQRAYAARLQSGRGGVFVFNGAPAGRYVVAAQTRLSAVREQVAVRQDAAVRVRLVLPGRQVREGGNERD